MTASNYFAPSQVTIWRIGTVGGSSPLVLALTIQVSNYQPGDRVRFSIPKQRGMQQLDGVIGEVLFSVVSVIGNVVAFNIDAALFDPFISYPLPLNPSHEKYVAQLIPVGERASNLSQATHNNNNIIPEIYGAKPSIL